MTQERGRGRGWEEEMRKKKIIQKWKLKVNRGRGKRWSGERETGMHWERAESSTCAAASWRTLGAKLILFPSAEGRHRQERVQRRQGKSSSPEDCWIVFARAQENQRSRRSQSLSSTPPDSVLNAMLQSIEVTPEQAADARHNNVRLCIPTKPVEAKMCIQVKKKTSVNGYLCENEWFT